MMGAVLGGFQLLLPEGVHAAESTGQVLAALPAPAFDLASDTPIWENVVRYAQYFLSVMLGTGYVMLKPFARLLKSPVTAVLLIGFTAGFLYFVNFTVKAMLGMEEPFDYNPSSAVTPQI